MNRISGSDLVVLVDPISGRQGGTGTRASSWTRVSAAIRGGKDNPAADDPPPDWREQVERAAKSELVATLHDVFQNTGVVVVAHYAGLTVSEMTDLRGRMRQAGARLKVAKNRLAKLALEGTEIAHVGSLLQGPTVIAYSDDPVAAPKVAVDFAKGNQKLVILGGAMGAKALDPEGVKSLATLPSLDELRAKLVGMINTPATRVAQVLAAPGGQVARVLAAYAEKAA